MTRVAFLHGAENRLRAAVQWLAKSSDSGLHVLAFVPDPVKRSELDAMLWTEPAEGFIPHCESTDPWASETPVVLCAQLDGHASALHLLNLSDTLPPDFGRFDHITEIIGQQEHERVPGRERFRTYRERGIEIESRDISRGL